MVHSVCPRVPSQADRDLTGFLSDVERTHGRLTVASTLAYLVLSHNGLTGDEVEDILSLDDDVLNDEFLRLPFFPAVRRFPEGRMKVLLAGIAPLTKTVSPDGAMELMSVTGEYTEVCVGVAMDPCTATCVAMWLLVCLLMMHRAWWMLMPGAATSTECLFINAGVDDTCAGGGSKRIQEMSACLVPTFDS